MLAVLTLAGCASSGPGDAARDAAGKASASASHSHSRSPGAGAAQARERRPLDKKAHSTTDPTSPWVIVNKKHPLRPVDYAPTDLVYPELPNPNHQPVRKQAARALISLTAAAARKGLKLSLESGYRSYSDQVSVYSGWVAQKGQKTADELSARPGTSEHQTGLAVDLAAVPANCSLEACFGKTAQGTWLAANAWRYGFLLRYPADKVAVTGYQYEPWHFRYVGVPLATELHRQHVKTLEEFFGVSGGTSY